MLDMLKDKSKLKQIQTSEKYALVRKNLINKYEEIRGQDMHISFEIESEFLKNGNRVHFEERYFLRRTKLTVCAILSIV